ncbi:MAG: hypothetical protein ABI610_13115, partial [Acidobacteriota bacterium]
DPDSLMEALRVEENADVARIAAARIVDLGRADLLVENLDARRIATIPAIEATLSRLQSLQKEAEENERRRRSRSAEPATLLNVIAETDQLDVALEALGRIQDQRALAVALRRSSFVRVQEAARERLTDPLVLREIVADSSFDVRERRAALGNVADSAFHETVAMTGTFPYELRLAALRLLRDPAALARIALTSDSSSLRYEVLEHADDDVREQIATSDTDPLRRYAAADRIRDSAVLERLALSAEESAVRAVAAGRLRDPGLLRRLLESERNPDVRAAIRERLGKDDVRIEEIRSGSPEERRRAVERLRDRSALEAIAQSDSELVPLARARLAQITEVETQIAELERRIERLKQLPDYRQDLEWKVSGDSQTFEAYMLSAAGRESPLLQVDRLEAEISSLRRTLG